MQRRTRTCYTCAFCHQLHHKLNCRCVAQVNSGRLWTGGGGTFRSGRCRLLCWILFLMGAFTCHLSAFGRQTCYRTLEFVSVQETCSKRVFMCPFIHVPTIAQERRLAATCLLLDHVLCRARVGSRTTDKIESKQDEELAGTCCQTSQSRLYDVSALELRCLSNFLWQSVRAGSSDTLCTRGLLGNPKS